MTSYQSNYNGFKITETPPKIDKDGDTYNNDFNYKKIRSVPTT